MRQILASIDIGSAFIKLVVGEIGKNGRINILSSSFVESLGIEKGFIIEPQALIPKLEEVFQKSENILGLKIGKVIVSVPSENCEFFLSEGSTTITNNEHIVKQIDVIRAMQASTYNKIEDGREIVSIHPTSYMIDEKSEKQPIGKEAKKLTVKSLVTTIPRKNVFTIVKCLEKIGVEVIDFSLSSIGDYHEFEASFMKDVVGCIINIGYQTTNVSIFNKGLLTNTNTLNLGLENVEHDLSYVFKLTKKDAKNVRESLVSLHTRGVSASLKKTYTTKTGSEVTISEYEATEVAYSRMNEILKLAKKEINLLTKKRNSLYNDNRWSKRNA